MRLALALTLALFTATPALAQSVAPPAFSAGSGGVAMPEVVGGLGALVQGIAYPQEALADRAEGRVIVRFVVTETGTVEEAEVFRPVHPALDAAALAAVSRARFRPAQRDGRAVRVRIALPITFALPGVRT